MKDLVRIACRNKSERPSLATHTLYSPFSRVPMTVCAICIEGDCEGVGRFNGEVGDHEQLSGGGGPRDGDNGGAAVMQEDTS